MAELRFCGEGEDASRRHGRSPSPGSEAWECSISKSVFGGRARRGEAIDVRRRASTEPRGRHPRPRRKKAPRSRPSLRAFFRRSAACCKRDVLGRRGGAATRVVLDDPRRALLGKTTFLPPVARGRGRRETASLDVPSRRAPSSFAGTRPLGPSALCPLSARSELPQSDLAHPSARSGP